MISFALLGLAVPAGLSMFTYYWARNYLLDQRLSSALHQTQTNANLARTLLGGSSPDPAQLLDSLASPSTSEPVLYYERHWYGSSAAAGPDTMPAPLIKVVASEHQAARQLYDRNRNKELAIGIPLPGGSAYFQVFSLADLTSTLATLRDALVGGSLLAFAVSLALGSWATRRVLKPVRDIGQAAASIAAGRLDARLDAEGDAELAELATGFNTMVSSLQDRLERDARFASDVSHELRSPLTTLNSAVQIMQNRRHELSSRSARALDLLTAEVERFQRLVEDLLEISRYDAGVAQLDLEPVDVAALVERLLVESGQPVTVQARSRAGGATVVADRRRLEHAVGNLIRNAVVHAGGVTGACVAYDGDETVITIEDRGPGIDAEDREAVFERFARGRAAGRRSSGGGVGLGLALVREHLCLQGGTVHFEPADPCGSRFVVTIPGGRP
ncbi:MAG: HAMP domain-containing protein [Acidobacteriota bacterium]|nr:HAMP domain-containing protein [Acidobacteriota bacterium]